MRRSDLQYDMTFQAPSTVTPTVWTTAFTCRGSILELKGAEKVQAMALGGIITGKVVIPYRPIKIRTTWRIRVKKREGESIMNIVGPPVNVDGKNMYWELRVKEVG